MARAGGVHKGSGAPACGGPAAWRRGPRPACGVASRGRQRVVRGKPIPSVHGSLPLLRSISRSQRESSVSKFFFSLSLSCCSPGVSRQFVASRWRPATATGRVACAASNRAPRRQCQRPASRAATIRRSRPAFAAGWRAPRRPAGRPAGHDLPVACWAGGRGDWRLACSNSKAIDALRCDAIADAAVLRDVPWCAFLSYFFVFGYYYEDTWLKWRCVRA